MNGMPRKPIPIKSPFLLVPLCFPEDPVRNSPIFDLSNDKQRQDFTTIYVIYVLQRVQQVQWGLFPHLAPGVLAILGSPLNWETKLLQTG